MTVQYRNPVNPDAQLGALYLFGFCTGLLTLEHSSGDTLKTSREYIGVNGRGAYNQTNGAHWVSGELCLGYYSGSQGTYNLQGGSLFAGTQTIGFSGNGAFTQSGGANLVSGVLSLGNYFGSRGTYNLQGGTLSSDWHIIGNGGTGTFTQSGGTLNATSALTNSGTYTMAGGTLTGDGVITNNAAFTGYGTINTNAGFSNYGTMTLTGGASTVNGTYTNQTSGQLNIIYNTATFTGDVWNYGNIKVTGTTPGDDSIFVRLGNFYNYGGYTSDPITHYFNSLVVGKEGYLQGGAGDKWILTGDFINQSTQNLTWNTVAADLAFTGGGNHLLSLPGADLGRTLAGYADNFAWGSLDITGQTLTLVDGNDTPGGALYVGRLLGLTLSGNTVDDILGSNGLNLYYDLFLNPDLGGLTYALAGGGWLAPAAEDLLALNPDLQLGQTDEIQQTPLPASAWLFLSGLAGLGFWSRMTRRGRGHK